LSIAATIAAGQLAVASPPPAPAAYSIVHSFTGAPTDGQSPYAGLIHGPHDRLYGTTYQGGSANLGAIFQMALDGSGFALLHSFTGGTTDGAYPYAGLLQGPDGTLYGTTAFGGSGNCSEPSGCGTVFQMALDGSGFTLLHNFTAAPTDGLHPYTALIQGPDGTLYGTTANGGSGCPRPSGCGTVFQMAPDGSGFTLLHSFTGVDGAIPHGSLLQGPDGTLYGTTVNGGPADQGTVFQMAPDGSGFALLHWFLFGPTEEQHPFAGVIQGPDGTLYGTTRDGGSAHLGTVFQMAPDGSGFTLLHSFTGAPTDGQSPYASLIQCPDGTLYGTTSSGGDADQGTIFRLAPDGSGFPAPAQVHRRGHRAHCRQVEP
jgi:uncharacterized repeat protein (TIGR03803 family)